MKKNERAKMILYIINKLNSEGVRNGETTIQKLTYFIKQKNILDVDYKYVLHNYGPFSFELNDDLKYLEESNLIEKSPDPDGFRFNYIPKSENKIVDNWLKNLDFDTDKIDCLLSEFHLLSAKKLGLIATSNYLYDRYKPENDEDLIHLVWKVKPIFSKEEIKVTIDGFDKFIKADTIEFGNNDEKCNILYNPSIT